MIGKAAQNKICGLSFNKSSERVVATKGAIPNRVPERAVPRPRNARMANGQGNANTVLQGLIGKYKDVDRQKVLEEVFRRLTANAKNETKKQKAVLYFVQKLSIHDFNSSFMGIPFFDPLHLFEVGAMDCQKTSRLVAGIYSAAGYESRFVDMYGHMVAEVKYDGGWHYADADMFGGGQIVTMPDGSIPSMAELTIHFQLLI